MPHRGDSRAPRHAVCIGLSRFGTHDEEPPPGSYPDLPYAEPRVNALTEALTSFGYSCQTLGDRELGSAAALGAAVTSAIKTAEGDAQVIHVLSHGYRAQSGVYVIGADGQYAPGTSVATWVASVQDFPAGPRPHTLFLIDTCHAGAAARLDWLRAADAGTRAWVIAATPDWSLAYDGRFSQAVANVLTRIHTGDIDFYPTEYIPFGHVVEHIRREVVTLGGDGQYVCSTPVDGSPEPPFFANPRSRSVTGGEPELWATLDAATQPFTELDPALDEAHFLDRATGHGGLGRAGLGSVGLGSVGSGGAGLGSGAPIGCFTGREHELETLTAWLDDPAAGGLRVITGGPGSGKSALLGLLVCAAHPGLRDRTRRLWEHVTAAPAHPIAGLAAVHLRERDLTQTLASLIRQLDLPVSESSPDPSDVWSAIFTRPQPPVIIFDALDEALTQADLLQHLLLPLATATRLDLRPACRLLVGMRPWEEFAPLLDVAHQYGATIDVDLVPASRLRNELEGYIRDLLELAPGYSRRTDLPVRRTIAQRTAQALTEPGRERGGEFLSAGLFVNWLITRHPTGASSAEATELTARVPRDIRDLLELDIESHCDHPWFRAVLLTVAQARGAGMPATVIRRLAPLCRTYASPSEARGELTVTEFDQALHQVRFYLRSSADTDGTTLYRLFHQGLVDQLRDEDVDLGSMVVVLLATAPKGADGRRRWDAAEPYVQRHALQHAADAGHLDDLLLAGPEELEPVMNAATTAMGRVSAAICRESMNKPGADDRAARRDLMTVNALRYGFPRLAARIAHVPGLPEHGWWPVWSTGGELPSIPRVVLASGGVHAIACGELHGQPVAVTCGVNGTVQIWDVVTGRPKDDPLSTGSTECAVACARMDGRSIAVTGDGDGKVQVWDLATRQTIGETVKSGRWVEDMACAQVAGQTIAITVGVGGVVRFCELAELRSFGVPPRLGDRDPVQSVAYAEVDGHPVVVTSGGLQDARVWDMVTGELVRVLAGHRVLPRAVACSVLHERPVAVTGGRDGAIQLWDLPTGRPIGNPMPGHVGMVNVVACTNLDGRPVAVTGGRDGTVRVWDLATLQPVGNPLTTSQMGEVTSLACAEVDGRVLGVSGNRTQGVSIWDLGDRRSTGDPSIGHSAEVTALTSVSVGGRRLVVSGGHDQTVRVWDCATGQPAGGPMDSDGLVLDLNRATLWSREVAIAFTGSGVGVARPFGSAVCAFDTAPHRRPMAGRRLLTGDIRGLGYTTVHGWPVAVTLNLPKERLGVWHLTTGRLLRELRLENFDFSVPSALVSCHLIGDRPVVVTAGGASSGEPIQVWDLVTGQAIGRPRTGHGAWIRAMTAVTVTNQPLLVTAGSEGSAVVVRVWDLTRDELLLHTLRLGDIDRVGSIRALACGTMDGRTVVATGGSKSAVQVWDLLARTQLDEFVFPAPVNALEFTEDGYLLVGFGWDVAVLRRTHPGKAVS